MTNLLHQITFKPSYVHCISGKKVDWWLMIGNILLMDQCDQLFDVQKSPNYQLKRNNTFFLCGFNNTRTLLFFTVQLTHTAQLLWLVSSQTDAVSLLVTPHFRLWPKCGHELGDFSYSDCLIWKVFRTLKRCKYPVPDKKKVWEKSEKLSRFFFLFLCPF